MGDVSHTKRIHIILFSHLGSCRVQTRRLVQGSVEWAQLEPGPEFTVAEVVARIQQGDSTEDPLYLFDWSLPLHCPQLARQVTIPKYFAGSRFNVEHCILY